MDDIQAKELIDKIVGQIFGLENPYTLEEFAAKFAFDIRLTSEVTDSWTNESTWAQSTKDTKYVNFKNLLESDQDSMIEKQPINSIEDIMKIWQQTSVTATERHLDSINVGKSDAIYGSQNVYRSVDIHDSKNIAFCDSVYEKSEYVAASQRSRGSVFAMRIDDSKNVSNSFQVSWSGNISNSFFIKDCSDIADSMFCSQVNGKRFCIANMQFEEEEYRKWEKLLKQWILSN